MTSVTEEDHFSILCSYKDNGMVNELSGNSSTRNRSQLIPKEVNKRCTVPHRQVQFTIKYAKRSTCSRERNLASLVNLVDLKQNPVSQEEGVGAGGGAEYSSSDSLASSSFSWSLPSVLRRSNPFRL